MHGVDPLAACQIFYFDRRQPPLDLFPCRLNCRHTNSLQTLANQHHRRYQKMRAESSRPIANRQGRALLFTVTIKVRQCMCAATGRCSAPIIRIRISSSAGPRAAITVPIDRTVELIKNAGVEVVAIIRYALPTRASCLVVERRSRQLRTASGMPTRTSRSQYKLTPRRPANWPPRKSGRLDG
jgi:hypothetical protein